ncbi:MAG: GldG family protein, partial [Polyangiaceae bacterium]
MSAERDEKKGPAVTKNSTAAQKVSVSIGLIAAMVIAVVANVLVSRHYKRWDVTRGGLYTLSDPTLQTLHGLEEPVMVYVMLPAGDPLTTSVGHLLEAYKAETTRLDVKPTDPDRHPAEFLAIQQKYGVSEGMTRDGRVLTDTAIIVAKGDKPYFLTANDLVAVEDDEDMRTRPRLEEALTTAIRSVTTGSRPKVCFAKGHGEKPLDTGGEGGLAALKDRLGKNNYDTLELPPAREGAKEELPGCDLLVIAGPTEPVPAEDVARFVGFAKSGGSVLLAVGPVPDPDDGKYVDLGLEKLFSTLGLKLESDFVFELDSKRKSPNGFGETFLPEPKPHPITDGLLKAADRGIGVTMTIASSLSKVPGEGATTPLLMTTDRS